MRRQASMVRHISSLILCLLILCGCKSGGMKESGARRQADYVPEIAPTSLTMVKSDCPSEKSAAEEAGNPPSQQIIQQVSATNAGANVQLTTSSDTASIGISLPDSIALALSQNPELVTLRQTERVSSATLGVAQTYPFNPFLQVQATPWQDARNRTPDATYHYVLLMQTIQLAWNIHQAELLALAQTERLYFIALYQRGLMELAEASDRNNQQLLNILEKRLEAGEATAADVAIVRVDAESTRQQLRLAAANYQSALRDLARQVGVSPQQIPGVDGDLREIVWTLPGVPKDSRSASATKTEASASQTKSNVLAWAASRPDVMAARSDIDVARANLCLASASKTPDLQIGPYYQTTADNTHYIGFRGQIDLPVINNGVPLERQRTAEHNQRLTAWQQAQRRAELDTEAALGRYETALMAAATDTTLTVSDLPAELEGLETQFEAGEVDVVRVVQARTSLIQNQRARLDLLNEIAQSAATLTGASGIPVDQLLQFSQE
ncbi:MAG: TolC family protein [Planctomycetales bacterium]|nr:TolC family protein [Planctomycetales bacterium]